MTSDDFVSLWKKEQRLLLDVYLDEGANTDVSQLLSDMTLTHDQRELMPQLLEAVTTDVMYSLLLGLDGAASIGNHQERYTILDESGTVISRLGEIETSAYEHFHSKSSE